MTTTFFSDTIACQKYRHIKPNKVRESWQEVAERVGISVTQPYLPEITNDIVSYVNNREFLPGGRYLAASGKKYHQVNNCALFDVEDNRESISELMHDITSTLMTGAGIGVVWSKLRGENAPISGLGGTSTGPTAFMQMVNECGRHIIQGGSRRCLPGSTLVTMSDFSKKHISDIKVGDEVLTRFGPRKVTNVFDQGEQPILKIETEYGSVKCSYNHRWLSTDKSRRRSFNRPAKNLKIGYKLYYHPSPSKPLTDTDVCSDNIKKAYTLGFYLGNGCAYHCKEHTHEVTLSIGYPLHNQNQINYLCDGMCLLGAKKTTVCAGHGDCTSIRCLDKALVDVFQQWKKPHQPFDIPIEIKQASFKEKCAFIAGWFDADGYYGKEAWSLSNKHDSVLKQLTDFLHEELGILITDDTKHEIRLTNFQRAFWEQYVLKYSFKKPKDSVYRKTSEIPTHIVNISDDGVEQTYDIEVEDVHEFIADDFVSHNSAIWAGLQWDHPDVVKFCNLKNWSKEVRALKAVDFNFPATMDMTNISVILNTEFFAAYDDIKHKKHKLAHQVYWMVVERMCKTAEPGFSVDCGENEGENLRNAPLHGDTNVLTDLGYRKIIDIVDKPAVLWTGKQWAKDVVFKKTGEMVDTIKVSLSNGHSIVCDPSHPFLVGIYEETGKGRIDRIRASRLIKGDLISVSIPDMFTPEQTHVTVLNVESTGKADVYCADVKVEEHSFVAEGVLVSNCTEITSRLNGDVCNLGSINMAKVDSFDRFCEIIHNTIGFLLCGTKYSLLPIEKMYKVREETRRLGLGLMGIADWLLVRGKKYGPDEELEKWLTAYKEVSDSAAIYWSNKMGVNCPIKKRAIAPTGTISIVGECCGGLEPIFAVALKRRYMKGRDWYYQYIIDSAAKRMIDKGVDPKMIEDAYDLAEDAERRIRFQAWMQKFVDHGISSTINMNAWGSSSNNENTIKPFGNILYQYLPHLRGVTTYPDGARGGQPLTRVTYSTAMKHVNKEFSESVVYEETTNEHSCPGGVCGV